MSIERITSKIIDDARAEADVILKQSRDERDSIVNDAKEKAQEIIETQKTAGESEKAKIIERKKASAEIEGRKIMLHEKQKLIDEVVDGAIQNLVEEKQKYVDFIVKGVEQSGQRQGEIILNAKDREEIGEQLIMALNTIISDSNFELSKETRPLLGGFVIRNGNIFINGSIENIIEEIRDEIALEVAKIIF
ncbi:MAG: V-type ATP synthase subunit E [Eubacteriales bacterium]|nr:V-type ATP synthase subunit E [Eubacteriales bacterium]MDY3332846.1 V-type ATP synthase subunit E [Gallibacter sp.]